MTQKKISLATLIKQQYPSLSAQEILVRILSGQACVDGEKMTDHTRLVKASARVSFLDKRPFVSRGGEKLDYILKKWQVEVKDKVFLDAGCSTGGFTDCLLKHGAALVYAVDVGYNQIDYSLRTHDRVRLFERTNIRSLAGDSLDKVPDSAVCDLSFRSVRGVAGQILDLIRSDSFIALVKPQFEYENPSEDFHGVVQRDDVLLEILSSVVAELEKESVYVSRLDSSPVRGRKGNREFFFELVSRRMMQTGRVLERLRGVINPDVSHK